MALTVAFSIGVSSDPSAIILNDLSTGSDGAVVGRKIALSTPNGLPYANSPYDWPNFPGTTSITINPLTQDQALIVTVNWVNNVGVMIYTSSLIYVFTQYGLQFLAGLTQQQIANPSIVDDQNFMQNKFTLFTELKSAQNAIDIGQSVSAAQSCVNRYSNMIQNQDMYF